MSDVKLYCIAGFITLFMFVFIIGAPMAVSRVGDNDQTTHHYLAH